jgi:hypothetical protein
MTSLDDTPNWSSLPTALDDAPDWWSCVGRGFFRAWPIYALSNTNQRRAIFPRLAP